MDEGIEIPLDSPDCIMIPAEIRHRLGLSPGMTLVVEKRETGEICLRVRKEFPELIDKGGILVVRAEATGDLIESVDRERGRRLSSLLERVAL
jgi:AbrB family looped-hinge helix DNA binding protein